MKLSEAIRLGSMMGPQIGGSLDGTRRKYFFGLIGPRVKAFCALGAAYEAATGGRSKEVVITEAHGAFRGAVTTGQIGQVMETPDGWPLWTEAPCPMCASVIMSLARLIPHLNDDHKWTRERIAQFVERYEIDESFSVPPVAAEVPGETRS